MQIREKESESERGDKIMYVCSYFKCIGMSLGFERKHETHRGLICNAEPQDRRLAEYFAQNKFSMVSVSCHACVWAVC